MEFKKGLVLAYNVQQVFATGIIHELCENTWYGRRQLTGRGVTQLEYTKGVLIKIDTADRIPPETLE